MTKPNSPPVYRWTHGAASLGTSFAIYFITVTIDVAYKGLLNDNLKLIISGVGVLPAFTILLIVRKNIQSPIPLDVYQHMGPLSLLYVGIASAGFVTAVNVVTGPNGTGVVSPLMIATGRMLLLISFLVTAIPFYHGALTHLQRKASKGKWRPFLDFLVLLLEAYVLLILSASSSDPSLFIAWLTLLFGIDVVWMLIALNDHRADTPPAAWLWLNATILLFLVVVNVVFHLVSQNIDFLTVLTLVLLLRSTMDYAIAWPHYFPETPASIDADNVRV